MLREARHVKQTNFSRISEQTENANAKLTIPINRVLFFNSLYFSSPTTDVATDAVQIGQLLNSTVTLSPMQSSDLVRSTEFES